MADHFEDYILTRITERNLSTLSNASAIIEMLIEYSWHWKVAYSLNIPYQQWLWCLIGFLVGQIVILWIVLAILVERALLLVKFQQDARRRLERGQPVLELPNPYYFRKQQEQRLLNQSQQQQQQQIEQNGEKDG